MNFDNTSGSLVIFSNQTGEIYQSNYIDYLDNCIENSQKTTEWTTWENCQVAYFPDTTIVPNQYYISPEGNPKELTDFPSPTVTNGQITGLPDNTSVRWPDGVETIENQEFEFTSNVSGVFKFHLNAAPYFSSVLEVDYHV